jgi:L-ribulose-5-phosphate 3-epimerase
VIKGINYWAFAEQADGSPFDQLSAMRRAKELGYDAIELTVDGPDGLVSTTSTQADAEKVRNEAEKLGIQLNTVASGLAWGTSPTHADPAVRASAVENTKKTLQVAAWLGASSILYLPGMVSAVFVPDFEPQRPDLVEVRAKESLAAVLPTAEKLGVTIAVENVWNRFLLSPMEMRDFIDSFDSELVGAYFDTGNCMLYGHPVHWIQILGSRIKAVHLKDFLVAVGNLDGFVDLLAGECDFHACFEAFRAVGYAGQYTVEYVPPTIGAVEKGIAALRVLEEREGV